MGKTLHIIPSGIIWPLIVEKWIGDEPDKANHEVIQYPVPTNLHYQPDSLTDVEMMKTAISWHKYYSDSLDGLYKNLLSFSKTVNKRSEYDKVIVWYAEDADSRLLFLLIANTVKSKLYSVDITPAAEKHEWEPYSEDYERFTEVRVFYDGDVPVATITRNSYKPQRITQKMRDSYYEIWKHWGGEDAQDCPILVSQFGGFFHPYRTYLYSDIFECVTKKEPTSISRIVCKILETHPQLSDKYVFDTVTKMANEGMIKWVEKNDDNPFRTLVQQYKYDVEGEWNKYPRDFLYHFAEVCGKKIKMSEDDLKAEFLRDRKDSDDMFCQGHLARADRAKKREQWEDRLVIQWAAAFNANWGWYHLISVMKVKMGMMVEYMRHWSPVANGPVYADQMERAIGLMEVILDWGGKSEYKHTEKENNYFDAKHFSRYVNFNNRKRFSSPDYDGHHFWCKAQRLRFDKAWNLLWEMFRTKLLTWDD